MSISEISDLKTFRLHRQHDQLKTINANISAAAVLVRMLNNVYWSEHYAQLCIEMFVPSVTRPPLTSEKCTSKTTRGDATRFKTKWHFFSTNVQRFTWIQLLLSFFFSESNELLHYTHSVISITSQIMYLTATTVCC